MGVVVSNGLNGIELYTAAIVSLFFQYCVDCSVSAAFGCYFN